MGACALTRKLFQSASAAFNAGTIFYRTYKIKGLVSVLEQWVYEASKCSRLCWLWISSVYPRCRVRTEGFRLFFNEEQKMEHSVSGRNSLRTQDSHSPSVLEFTVVGSKRNPTMKENFVMLLTALFATQMRTWVWRSIDRRRLATPRELYNKNVNADRSRIQMRTKWRYLGRYGYIFPEIACITCVIHFSQSPNAEWFASHYEFSFRFRSRRCLRARFIHIATFLGLHVQRFGHSNSIRF